jgi:hypothetical protein
MAQWRFAIGSSTSGRTDPTDQTDRSDQRKYYSEWLNHRNPAMVANALICLMHQANYLHDRQIQGLERQFVGERRLQRTACSCAVGETAAGRLSSDGSVGSDRSVG